MTGGHASGPSDWLIKKLLHIIVPITHVNASHVSPHIGCVVGDVEITSREVVRSVGRVLIWGATGGGVVIAQRDHDGNVLVGAGSDRETGRRNSMSWGAATLRLTWNEHQVPAGIATAKVAKGGAA